jgi:glycerol uptake facilitator-like aquaporin
MTLIAFIVGALVGAFIGVAACFVWAWRAMR